MPSRPSTLRVRLSPFEAEVLRLIVSRRAKGQAECVRDLICEEGYRELGRDAMRSVALNFGPEGATGLPAGSAGILEQPTPGGDEEGR